MYTLVKHQAIGLWHKDALQVVVGSLLARTAGEMYPTVTGISGSSFPGYSSRQCPLPKGGCIYARSKRQSLIALFFYIGDMWMQLQGADDDSSKEGSSYTEWEGHLFAILRQNVAQIGAHFAQVYPIRRAF